MLIEFTPQKIISRGCLVRRGSDRYKLNTQEIKANQLFQKSRRL